MPTADRDSEKASKTSIGQDTPTQQTMTGARIASFFDDKALKTVAFGDSKAGENVYRRAERVTAAVHLLTSHIEESEPIRMSLRKESIRLLDCALRIHGELRASNSERVRKTHVSIRKLISLVRTAGIIGRISEQNAHILVDALDDLGNFLTLSQRTILAEGTAISRNDLLPLELHKEIVTKQKGMEKRRTSKPVLKDTIKDMHVQKTTLSEGRAERISGFLRTGGQFGIKDISANFPEYSEKMIQRDLAIMVDSGVVRKTGEKRWSKYELVL